MSDTKSLLMTMVKNFDPSVVNSHEAWKCWINHFEMSMAALQIEESTAKKSWLFLLGGKKLLVLDDFMIRQRSRGNLRVPLDEDYSACKRRFTDYFSERRYIEKFRQIVQVDGENFENFVARLRSGSKLCQFNNDPNEEIKRQISTGARSLAIRQKAFNRSCSIRELLDFGKNIERDEEVKNLKLDTIKSPSPTAAKKYIRKHRAIFCIRCGCLVHTNMKFCRGVNEMCHYCGIKGHIKKCCMHRVLESEHIKAASARLQM